MDLKYRFYGDELQLLKYEIEVPKYDIDGTRRTYTAASEQEKNEVLKRYPDAKVSEITDNTGYEWLDGMTFTRDQLRAGDLERAIELGEVEYKRQKEESDPEYRVKVLEDALLELAAMISEVNENG